MLHEKAAEATEHYTSKQRAAVQREVVRLLDELAPEKPPQRRDAPAPSVAAHRWPARCILQGASSAVSVSWFPARPAEEALGEILVIAWNGVVAVPGVVSRGQGAPQARRTVTLQPVEQDGGDFKWRQPPDDDLLLTNELATYCRQMLED